MAERRLEEACASVATGHNVPATVCRRINRPFKARKARSRWDPSGRIKAGRSSVSNWNPPRSEIRAAEPPRPRTFPVSGPDSVPLARMASSRSPPYRPTTPPFESMRREALIASRLFGFIDAQRSTS
jgi:hypothetical protein